MGEFSVPHFYRPMMRCDDQSIKHTQKYAGKWKHFRDAQMLVSSCLLEQASGSFVECHAKDLLHAPTE